MNGFLDTSGYNMESVEHASGVNSDPQSKPIRGTFVTVFERISKNDDIWY